MREEKFQIRLRNFRKGFILRLRKTSFVLTIFLMINVNSQLESEPFLSVKHYALEHFKDRLESELGPLNSKDFLCSICKPKKLKSRFDSRQELLLHNAGFHLRAQVLLSETLSEALGDNSKENSSNKSSTKRGSRTRNRAKQSSDDSVIEIESNSGSSIGSQNGLEELSKSSEASDNTETIDLEEEDEDEEEEEREGVEEEEIQQKDTELESKNQVKQYCKT